MCNYLTHMSLLLSVSIRICVNDARCKCNSMPGAFAFAVERMPKIAIVGKSTVRCCCCLICSRATQKLDVNTVMTLNQTSSSTAKYCSTCNNMHANINKNIEIVYMTLRIARIFSGSRFCLRLRTVFQGVFRATLIAYILLHRARLAYKKDMSPSSDRQKISCHRVISIKNFVHFFHQPSPLRYTQWDAIMALSQTSAAFFCCFAIIPTRFGPPAIRPFCPNSRIA